MKFYKIIKIPVIMDFFFQSQKSPITHLYPIRPFGIDRPNHNTAVITSAKAV